MRCSITEMTERQTAVTDALWVSHTDAVVVSLPLCFFLWHPHPKYLHSVLHCHYVTAAALHPASQLMACCNAPFCCKHSFNADKKKAIFLFFYPKSTEHRVLYINCLVLVGVFCSLVLCAFVLLTQWLTGHHRKPLSASSGAAWVLQEESINPSSFPPLWSWAAGFQSRGHKYELMIGISNKPPDTDIRQINGMFSLLFNVTW